MGTNKFLHSADFDFFPPIVPAKDNFPSWYKDMPRTITNYNSVGIELETTAIRACVPFRDAFLVGYQIPLVCDVKVIKQKGKEPYYQWTDENIVPLQLRPNTVDSKFPVPEHFSKDRTVWLTKHNFEIPNGYSAIITHPLNRFDLPFITLSGIVDDFIMWSGNLPFYFYEDFEGLIPKGTPIAQIIPFKRESWVSEISENILKKAREGEKKRLLEFTDWYKKNIWKKKSFE